MTYEGRPKFASIGNLVENFDSKRIPLSSREREKRKGSYPYYGAAGEIDSVDDYLFEGLHLLVGEDGSVVRTDGTPFLQLVDGKFWVNNHAHVLSAHDDIDTRFIYYALSTTNISGFATGAVQPKLNQRNLNAIEIWFPRRNEREKLVKVLGSLDDKIDLNRRMNRTLEEMARALFKSWFVDFDPVHANAAGNPTLPPDLAAIFPVEFEPSSIGDIPQGWEAEELNRVISIFDSKRIPLSKRQRESRPGCYPYHGAAGVMDYVDDFLFDGIYVLMGEDGSVVNNDGSPVLQYVWGKLWVNNHAHVLEGRNISTEHLYLHLRETNIAPFVTGAVQPKLNQGNLKKVPFVLPPSELCRLFANRIDPLFARIRVNAEETAILASLRDALLPRLLSGELSVAAAEEAIA